MAETVKKEALADASKLSEVVSDKEIVKIAGFRAEIIKRLNEYNEAYAN
jgi:hypothetical protein